MQKQKTLSCDCRCLVGILITVLAAVLLQPEVHGQALNGTLVGNVTDSSQAAIPGATISIVNVGTGYRAELRSNAEGMYSLANVPPGTYDITFSAGGFRTATTKGVVVGANSTIRSDAQLEIGVVTESIEVSARALALQTDTADIRGEIRTSDLQNAPVPLKRNFQSLLMTVPGFSPPSGGTINMVNPAGSLSMKANGTNAAAVTYRLDGTISRDLSSQKSM